MSIFKNSRSRKNISFVRILSAVIVLGVLVVIVAETAKYMYVAKLPDQVSSRLDPSLDKLVAVLGAAKSSLQSSQTISEPAKSEQKPVLKVGILSDSHNDFEYLQAALDKLKDANVEHVFFLGDYTDYGELDYLSKAKEVMDSSEVSYSSLPGDHDLGETRDASNFNKVFGKEYGAVELEDIKFTYFDNSKNYTAIEERPMLWFKEEISDTDFLFLSQPLMTGNMGRVMGILDGVKDTVVYSQNQELTKEVYGSSVLAIFAGDLHQFSRFQDLQKADLHHYSIGAVLKSQSLEKLNLQSPRFAILEVFDDKSYVVKDIPID